MNETGDKESQRITEEIETWKADIKENYRMETDMKEAKWR